MVVVVVVVCGGWCVVCGGWWWWWWWWWPPLLFLLPLQPRRLPPCRRSCVWAFRCAHARTHALTRWRVALSLALASYASFGSSSIVQACRQACPPHQPHRRHHVRRCALDSHPRPSAVLRVRSQRTTEKHQQQHHQSVASCFRRSFHFLSVAAVPGCCCGGSPIAI